MFKKFLVAVDLEHDTHNDRLLRVTSDMANAQGAQVHLLHVIRAAPAVVSQFLPKSYETMASERIEKDLTARAQASASMRQSSALAMTASGRSPVSRSRVHSARVAAVQGVICP